MELQCAACGYAEKLHRPEGRHEFVRPKLSRVEPITDPLDEIILPSRPEAQAVLDALQVMIDTYSVATIADLYDLVGITGKFTDEKWGWANINEASISRVKEGYLLNLPKSTLISAIQIPKESEELNPNLERELAAILNKYSAENASNTPDFILAEYLTGCLKAFNLATKKTKEWMGD